MSCMAVTKRRYNISCYVKPWLNCTSHKKRINRNDKNGKYSGGHCSLYM